MTGAVELLSGAVRVDRGVVVEFVGEIDVVTVAIFEALIDQALAVGVPRMTVDMAGVDFMGACGLSVLLGAAQQLRERGGRLEVRAVPARIYRLFDITGLTESLDVERPMDSSNLVQTLARSAALPMARGILDAALKLVVTMAQAVVVGADGVSITLPRSGRLGTVAASNDVVLEMDHDQYDTGEGPCLDAATQGERFHILSLREEDRWPAFVPRARARGIESILSTPLVAADLPIGALNVYSRTVGAFAEHEKQWADQFAAEAAVVVAHAEVGETTQELHKQLQEGLMSREVIALAQGVMISRTGRSPEAAYVMLRDLSRRTGQPLREVCARLLTANSGAAPVGRKSQESPDGRPTS